MNEKIEKCIYCGAPKLTKTHVFPKVIGGKAKPYLACKSCNNLFADHVDRYLEKNIFIANALAKLQLKTPDKAFKKAVMKLPAFNDDVEFMYDKEGKLIPRTNVDKYGTSYLPQEKAKEILPKMLEDEITKDELHKLIKFFEDGNNRALEVGNFKVSIPVPSDLTKEVHTYQLNPNLNPKLLAKIAYEHLAIWKLHEIPVVQSYKNKFLNVAEIQKDRINEELKLLTSGVGNIFAVNDFSKLNYKPFFYVYIGISQAATIYSIVGFYGIIMYLISIGQCMTNVEQFKAISDYITLYFTDDPKIGFTSRPPQLGELTFEHYGKIADAYYRSSIDYKNSILKM